MSRRSQNTCQLTSVSVQGPLPISVRMFGVDIMPFFSLCLLVCGVTFSVYTFTNGSMALELVEVTPLLHSTTETDPWQYHEHGNCSDPNYQPLLTLFTSFKNTKNKWRMQWNVIQNWALFQPKVHVVLFDDSTDESLLEFAHSRNWTILPRLSGKHHSTSLLKEMFLRCQRYIPNSVFYGYANGEILFDRGLLQTVEAVSGFFKRMEQTLIAGQSTSFNIRGRRITTLEEVRKIANAEGKPFLPVAEDYFILIHNKFPWEIVPEIIGRQQLDTYLLTTAQNHGFAVIDATQTLIALHQAGYSSRNNGHKYTDLQQNIKNMGSLYHSNRLTSRSQFVTHYNKSGHIELCKKPNIQGPTKLITLPKPPAQTPSVMTNITKYKESVFSTPIKSFQTSVTSNIRNESQEQLVYSAMRRDIKEDRGQRIIEDVIEDEHGNNCLEHSLLTLFTIFTTHHADSTFHINILQNWAGYHPNVSTVLFSDDRTTVIETMATQLNWTVLPTIPQTGASLPLKKMFLQVQHLYPRSMFYAYVKGDLLFGTGLVPTVQEIVEALGDDLESALLVGAKYQYSMLAGQKIYEPSMVERVISATDSVSQSDIDENFVLAHHLFPWQHIPDLVIGNSVYDNYLIALALRYDFAVVDATHTLTALEQIPNDASLIQTKPDDFDPNLLAALDYDEGYVTSAQYETTYDASGKVKLWRRQREGRDLVLLSQP